MKLVFGRTKKMIAVYILAALAVVIVALLFGGFTARDRGVLLQSTKKFEHNGIERSYLLHAPKVITEDTKLVVGLHGFGGDGRQFAYYTGLHNADGNTVVVYPDAITNEDKGFRSGWNASFCCGAGWQAEIDDIGFIASLTESIAEEYGISEQHRFLTGFSNGAFMTHRIAAESPDTFQAYAPISGAIGANDIELLPTEPVAIYMTHGTMDQVIPISGGAGSTDPDFAWRAYDQTVATWNDINENEARVQSEIHPEDGHNWHDWRLFNFWNKTPQGSKDVMSFFNKQ